MKRVAKRDFGRCNGTFLAAAALLVAVAFIATLPTYFGKAPSAQQMQNLLTKTSHVMAQGASASTQNLNQLTSEWLNIYGGQKNTQTSTYVLLLSELLLIGVMVLQVGMSHVSLMASAGGEPKFKDFFTPLKRFGRWLVLYLWMYIRITLWTFLFVIPGIIAAYRYRQAVYLMLEDPEMGVNEALRLSGKLMRGYKARLFFLDLSFIFWLMLGSLISAFASLNLLGFYLLPYMELTRVQFYYDLRREHSVEGLPPTMAFAIAASATPQSQPPISPTPPQPPAPPTNPPA